MDSKTTLKAIWTTAGRTKWKIALLMLLQSGMSLINVSCALILRNVINAAVAGSREAFFPNLALFLGLIGCRILAGAANRYFQEDVCARLENQWKQRMFSVLLGRDFAQVHNVHSGEWMTRLTNDTTIVAGAMTSLMPDLGGMVVRLLGAAGAILVLEPRFFYLLLPCSVGLVAVSVLFRGKMKQLHRAVQERDGSLRAYLQECFAGMLVLRSYGREEAALDRASAEMDAHRTARMDRLRFSNTCNTGFSLFMNGIYAAGVCFCVSVKSAGGLRQIPVL